MLDPNDLIPIQPLDSSMRTSPKFLVESIRDRGFLTEFAVKVFRYNNCYFIYHGHHRVLGSVWANKKAIPCIEITNKEVIDEHSLNLNEFIKREMLSDEELFLYWKYTYLMKSFDTRVKSLDERM